MSEGVNRFPKGWDEARVRDVIEHYESQTEDEAVAEDEAAFEDTSHTVCGNPQRSGSCREGDPVGVLRPHCVQGILSRRVVNRPADPERNGRDGSRWGTGRNPCARRPRRVVGYRPPRPASRCYSR